MNDPIPGMSLAPINRSSPVPLYAQLIEVLSGAIEKGVWQPGCQIPPEFELCATFQVSRTVIRQALNEMTYRGLLTRIKGKGTFVTRPKFGAGLVQKMTGTYQNMLEEGFTPETRVLKQQVRPANPKIAGMLNLTPGTPVIDLERVRLIQNEPVQLVSNFLPFALCSKLVSADLVHQSLYSFLEHEYGYVAVKAHRYIEAVGASHYAAQMLKVSESSPLLLLTSINFLQDGTPIEYYEALHRADRTRFLVEVAGLKENGGIE